MACLHFLLWTVCGGSGDPDGWKQHILSCGSIFHYHHSPITSLCTATGAAPSRPCFLLCHCLLKGIPGVRLPFSSLVKPLPSELDLELRQTQHHFLLFLFFWTCFSSEMVSLVLVIHLAALDNTTGLHLEDAITFGPVSRGKVVCQKQAELNW